MRFSWMKGKGRPGNAGGTISKGAKVAFWFAGFLWLPLLGWFERNYDQPQCEGFQPGLTVLGSSSREDTARNGMDPWGRILGTNEKESFPNERPAHLVQVQGFWIDKQDVTNAECSKFVAETGYLTTAERKIDWEDLKRRNLLPGHPSRTRAL